MCSYNAINLFGFSCCGCNYREDPGYGRCSHQPGSRLGQDQRGREKEERQGEREGQGKEGEGERTQEGEI